MSLYQKGMHYSEDSHQWHQDGNEIVSVQHVVVGFSEIAGPDGKVRRHPVENRTDHSVKYKDWEWRCRKCFPDYEKTQETS